MYHQDGRLLETSEALLIHVDLSTRKSCLPGELLAAKLATLAAYRAQLSAPY